MRAVLPELPEWKNVLIASVIMPAQLHTAPAMVAPKKGAKRGYVVA